MRRLYFNLSRIIRPTSTPNTHSLRTFMAQPEEQKQLEKIEQEVADLDKEAFAFLREKDIIDISMTGSVNPESLTPETP